MRLSSTPAAVKSFRCCAVMSSGPPADPQGNEEIAVRTSDSDICKGGQPSWALRRHGFRNQGRRGCFKRKASRVSTESVAGRSSEHKMRMAAFIFPSSIFAATAFAKCFMGSFGDFTTCFGWVSTVLTSSNGCGNEANLFLMRLLIFLFFLPLFGFARMREPNKNRVFQLSTFSVSSMTSCIKRPSTVEQPCLDERGMRSALIYCIN